MVQRVPKEGCCENLFQNKKISIINILTKSTSYDIINMVVWSGFKSHRPCGRKTAHSTYFLVFSSKVIPRGVAAARDKKFYRLLHQKSNGNVPVIKILPLLLEVKVHRAG